MTGPLQLTFVTSAVDISTLPGSPAEVAVVGRSNVGKSSLINALANHKQLARVSNTPGRTQLINLFALPNGSTLVDLPGYGYAAVPGRIKQGWQKMIEGYLLDREELVNVYVLVDGEIGPTKLDVQMLTWLRANGVPAHRCRNQARQSEIIKACDAQERSCCRMHARSRRHRLGECKQRCRYRTPSLTREQSPEGLIRP